MSTTTLQRVETPRLICERLRAAHGEEVRRLLRDPRVSRTLWPSSKPPSERDLIASLAAKLAHWERHGFGLWLLRDRHTAAMVGRGGLQWTHVAGRDEVEAGWAIVPERWREGLATEMAHAAVGVAFGHLGLSEIVAFTLPHNLASRRVMEKTGFVYERPITYAGLRHVLYRARAG